jgi:hypothetical protein
MVQNMLWGKYTFKICSGASMVQNMLWGKYEKYGIKILSLVLRAGLFSQAEVWVF